MQLMPATAKETAKKAGITFKPLDLINADKNINLGSLYLSSLMRAFGNNRILTSAAYNAGPGKVKQWMHSDNQKVPFDIWVEAIPYKETRLYVQNILSFSVIYAYRTGTKQVFITPEESAQLL
jgi:soluble lytic murein transglycosylase